MNRTTVSTATALATAVAAVAAVSLPTAPQGGATQGTAVRAAALVEGATPLADGTYVIGEAITAADGRANTTATAPTPRVDTACTDATYALKTWRVTGTLTWYYNGTAAAPAVAGTALQAITNASTTVAKGVNRCGKPATFTTTYKYGGTATAAPQVAADASCTGNDGKSVTGWGALPVKVLAYTCTYFSSKGVVLASDTLIDNRAYTWFTTLPANCASAYDLETTMAHERLHTAGLAHVDQTKNASQVMTPASSPCDTTRRTLAAGDYAGLAALAAQR
ncbi:peptidase M10A [Actinokineospora bangkokensis]|uniref:Peptidase M10A n=1 Tax=Actinokineospora bangkokensis TaxID=1193682 RepID=A0A1Q9LJ81_9PSEU|nr:peptidase M10A [Actinokineospora bangkokensis]OLR92055.1 peptidase M10A [Actinokineospora bangkokensis]